MHLWCIRLKRQGNARRKPAAAATGQNLGPLNTHLARLLGYLKPAGALPRDHIGIVKGFDQRQAALFLQARADHIAILPPFAVIKDHFGPIKARIVDLGLWRIGGHDDGGLHPMQRGGIGHTLRMIAR